MLQRKITGRAFYGLYVQVNYQCCGNVSPNKFFAKGLEI